MSQISFIEKIITINFILANVKRSAGCAPLILIIFIDMALFSTSKPIEKDCDAYMFEGQHTLQTTLLIIALTSVPILFFGTPFYVYKSNKKKKLEALVSLKEFQIQKLIRGLKNVDLRVKKFVR